jgi:hypothetical protein
VEQGVTAHLGRRGRICEHRQVLLEPRRRADPEREEWLRVDDHIRPPVQPELALDRGGHAGGRCGGMHDVEGRPHRVDASGIPWWRPGCPGQVLEDECGRSAVVVPSERAREERVPIQRLVHAVFGAEPVGRVVECRDLHERGAPILQLDDEASVRGGAVPGRGTPGDRRRPQRTAHSRDIDRVGLHASEATGVRRRGVGSIAVMAVLA